MATNPKPLRGLVFETWYQERKARYEKGELGLLFRSFLKSKERAGHLYKAHLRYKRLIARYTEAGFRGYNADGQWIRRESKKGRRKWKPKSS